MTLYLPVAQTDNNAPVHLHACASRSEADEVVADCSRLYAEVVDSRVVDIRDGDQCRIHTHANGTVRRYWVEVIAGA